MLVNFFNNRLIVIWGSTVLFVLLQFFLQLSSGIVMTSIMKDLNLSAGLIGLLASSVYFIYLGLQIPAGILFDQKNTPTILAISAFICGLGCIIFASSHNLLGLFLGRILIGGGSAFAFVGYSHVLRCHFPLKNFAFLMGFSETLAFIVTAIGMLELGQFISSFGWRNFIYGAGFFAFVSSYLCAKNIPNSFKTISSNVTFLSQISRIIKNPYAWINGLFAGLSFTIVTVFGALWGVPFIQLKLSADLSTAGVLVAFFYLGAALSCPLFGILATHFQRKPLIITSCLSTLTLFCTIIFANINSNHIMGFLLFSMGSSCGAYMLAFSISNELAPLNLQSTCTGFTNTLTMITAPLFQILIGLLLDYVSDGNVYTLDNYILAFYSIIIALITATFLVFFLPGSNYYKRST